MTVSFITPRAAFTVFRPLAHKYDGEEVKL